MLHNVTSDTLSQLRYIIYQLTDEEYTCKLNILNKSSIGQHVRHVLEFYICLSEGIHSGVVDYDKRTRNLSIENDPKFAIKLLDELSHIFCIESIEDKPLKNLIEFNGVKMVTDSSVGREMVYLIEHSVHHYAIIAITLRNDFNHIAMLSDFGVAYSTSKHKRGAEKELVHEDH